MVNLQSNGISSSGGFPQNLRKVALTNGSGIGILQPDGVACGKVLKMDAVIRNWIFAVLPISSAIVRHKVSESNIYFTSDYGSRCKIFDGWYKVGRWGKKPYEEKFAKSPALSKSYDRVPGGKFNTQEVMKEEGQETSWVGGLIHGQNFTSMVNNHSFIPTVSALALTNSTTRDWSEDISTRNLVCSDETPFDDYFTPNNNEEHVYLSSENVSWMKAQINGDFQNCVNICAPVLLSGAEYFCDPVSNSYTISGLPSNAEIIWTALPVGIVEINSPSNLQTTLNRKKEGIIILTATVLNGCSGEISYSKTISVGVPTVESLSLNYNHETHPIRQQGTVSVCIQSTIRTVLKVNGPGSVTWNRVAASPSSLSWVQNGNDIEMFFWDSGQYQTFEYAITNTCGTTTKVIKFKAADCGGGGIINRTYELFPNPATNQLHIRASKNSGLYSSLFKTEDQAAPKRDITIKSVKIFSINGILKMQQSFKIDIKDIVLDISMLQQGSYFIEISDGLFIETQKLVISKRN